MGSTYIDYEEDENDDKQTSPDDPLASTFDARSYGAALLVDSYNDD